MRAALPDEIKTARLRLRPPMAADRELVVEGLNDLAVSGWLARVVHPYSTADFDAYFPQARAAFNYVIEDEAGFAGCISLNPHIGYWLSPPAQGRGYATEAARAILAAHFAVDADAVVSGFFEGNDRSAHVLTKLGFVETGRGLQMCLAFGAERAHVDLVLTRSDFIAAQPMLARSARLGYRDLQPFDATDLHAIVSNWDVARQLGSFPWPSDPAFTATRAQPYTGDGFAWGVHLNGALIGTIAVTKGELGYMIAPAQWRQGFAEEACRCALAHAFETLSLDDITAGVWADNDASRGVLAKLGFEVIAETNQMSKARGVMADGFDLALTRAAWAERRGA